MPGSLLDTLRGKVTERAPAWRISQTGGRSVTFPRKVSRSKPGISGESNPNNIDS